MLKRVGLLALLAVAAVAAYGWRSPEQLKMATWYFTGRAAQCPLRNTLDAPGQQKRQIAVKDRILAASRKLETDEKGYERWSTPKGEFWIPKGSHYVLPFNLAEQDRQIYTHDDVRIQAGDTVLDCGANIGVYTRSALEQGAARVVAIEPGPENIECLRRNFAKEIAAGKVIVYPKGVWDKDDILTLHVDPNNSAADSFVIQRAGAKDVLELPLTTIDKLVRELNLDRVDFIKMDIEGAEVRAIQGALQTLVTHHPRMALSSYHVPTDPVEIPAAVLAARPEYQISCGVCAATDSFVRPDILFFR